MTDNVADVNEELKAEVRLPKATFPELLDDWVPVDEAMFLLGRSLGEFPPDQEWADFRKKVGSLWVNSPVGNALYDCLTTLHKAGVLGRQHRDGHDYEFGWIPKSFR